jgi:hypothetical protein
MVSLLRIAGLLVKDAFRWVLLLFRSAEAVQTENLFLRRQLALYIERDVQPRRIDAATRVSLALLARLFDWRGALVVVQPATMIRWHRAGWRLLWRMKSRPGRPPIPVELRELIPRMARENVLWGEERIANELLLKLGIWISPRTVRKYLPKRPPGRPRGDLRSSTFLKSHARGILACDFFVTVTATFRLLYVFVVIEHGTRRLAHVNVTTHPNAAWTLQQLREVIADAECERPGRGIGERQDAGVERQTRPVLAEHPVALDEDRGTARRLAIPEHSNVARPFLFLPKTPDGVTGSFNWPRASRYVHTTWLGSGSGRGDFVEDRNRMAGRFLLRQVPADAA